MNPMHFVPLIVKQVTRHRVRTLLTTAGIAMAMFLFTAVQAMQEGVARVTRATAQDTTLVVYRKDRFCPSTSRLPEDYMARITRIDGVTSVLPLKIVVSNCRTSLDVVTFRGVPKDAFLDERGSSFAMIDGTLEDWQRRTDASLIGQTLARRRGLKPGMTFDAAGITSYVAGIIQSDDPQDQNAAYTALPFLQMAGRDQMGIVTQFNVTVAEPSLLEPVAREIDELFSTAAEPTATYSEKAFIGKVAGDVLELVGFARWLGLGCLVAVLALVGNAIFLGSQSRISEHAIMQTLGYTGTQIGLLIVGEGVLTAMLGGLVGAVVAVMLAHFGSFALSVEGQTIPIVASPMLLATGLLICGALGIVAGLAPAWQASRRRIAACFRAV